MKKYYIDEMTLAQMVVRVIETQYATVNRTKSLIPDNHSTTVTHECLSAQMDVLSDVIGSARTLLETVQVEDCEEN